MVSIGGNYMSQMGTWADRNYLCRLKLSVSLLCCTSLLMTISIVSCPNLILTWHFLSNTFVRQQISQEWWQKHFDIGELNSNWGCKKSTPRTKQIFFFSRAPQPYFACGVKGGGVGRVGVFAVLWYFLNVCRTLVFKTDLPKA